MGPSISREESKVEKNEWGRAEVRRRNKMVL